MDDRIHNRLRLRMKIRKPPRSHQDGVLSERQAEFLFEHIFFSAPDGMLLVNQDGIILQVNHQIEGIFGYARAEIVGKPVDSLVPARYRGIHSGHRQHFHAAPRMRPMGNGLELFGLKKDGSEFPLEILLSPLAKEGSLLVLCVIRDISEQKRAEKVIQQQTAMVALLQDVAVASNEAQTIEFALRFTIDRICAVTGWPVGHALLMDEGKKLVSTRIWHLPETDQYDEFVSLTETMSFEQSLGFPGMVIESEEPIWFGDYRKNRSFKRSRHALNAGIKAGFFLPILIQKEVAAVLEFFTDQETDRSEPILDVMPHLGSQLGRVLERKRAEKALKDSETRFRTIFLESATGIILCDMNGYVIETNPALQFILNTDADKLRQVGLNQILHPDEIKKFDTIVKKLYDKKSEDERLETRFVDRNKNVVWVKLNISMVCGESADNSYQVILVEDISQQKQMQAELKEVKRRLHDSIEAERNRLAQDLHDGPIQDLYGIDLKLVEMRNTLLGTGQENDLHMMQNSVEQVINTIRNICSELRPPVLAQFGLDKAIRSHLQRYQGENAGINIHLDLNGESQSLPEQVRVIFFRNFQQFLSNVIRHANARNIWVRLKMDDQAAVLEIEDDGVGIKTPVRWVDLAREGHLGLVGAAERAESLGGKLEITGRFGKGTLLRTIIPIEKEHLYGV